MLRGSSQMISKMVKKKKEKQVMERNKLFVRYKEVAGQIFVQDVEEIQTVRKKNEKLEAKVESLTTKLKTKTSKVRELETQLSEMKILKLKAETTAYGIPELQRQIDELSEENTQLKRDLIAIQLQEHQGIQNAEREAEIRRKKENETRKKSKKEEWEYRVLGIGSCRKCKHEINATVNKHIPKTYRPMSAPDTVLRPSTARPRRSSSKPSRPTTALLQREHTLTPRLLNSGANGRKTKKLIAKKQEKIILSSPRNSASSMTRSPSQNSMTPSTLRRSPSQTSMTYSHMSRESTLPQIQRKQNTDKTKAFVWTDDDDVTKVDNQRSGDQRSGQEDDEQTLVVGDHVVVAMSATCPEHGDWKAQLHGIIKFMGFVHGNADSMYLGVRLSDDDVGVCDGVIEGRRYFRCERERGVFVRLRDVLEVIPQESEQEKGKKNDSEIDSDDSDVQRARILEKYSIKTP